METIRFLVDGFWAAKDPRTSAWPLMDSPWPTLVICAIYLFIVVRSRVWMANRPPFEISRIIIIYNFAMVCVSVWLVYEFIYIMYYGGYSLGCQPVDKSMSDLALRTVRVGFWFYFTKIIELSDTMFFVLRKKFNLITFLHVFHHVSMPPSLWVGVNITPGGLGAYYTMLNSLVHVFMYTYYGIASAGPKYRKYLWWKRHMTAFQLIQFFLLMLHSSQVFFIECDFPVYIGGAIFTYCFLFSILFSNYLFQDIKRSSRAASHSNGTTIKSNGHHVVANGHKGD